MDPARLGVAHFDGLLRAVDGRDLGIHPHPDVEVPLEEFRGLHEELVPLGDASAYVIRETAVGVGDVGSPLEHDDFRLFVVPSQSGGGRGPARDSTDDYYLHGFLRRKTYHVLEHRSSNIYKKIYIKSFPRLIPRLRGFPAGGSRRATGGRTLGRPVPPDSPAVTFFRCRCLPPQLPFPAVRAILCETIYGGTSWPTRLPISAPTAAPANPNARLRPSARRTEPVSSIPMNARAAVPALRYARWTPSRRARIGPSGYYATAPSEGGFFYPRRLIESKTIVAAGGGQA